MAQHPRLARMRAATPALAGGLSAGFTLIELMVTLTILVMLLLVAGPLASDWVHGARTHQGRAQLVQAYSQAKALALRNPCGVTGTEAAALLNSSSDGTLVTLTVEAGDPSSSCAFLESDRSPNPQWSTTLPQGVTLEWGNPLVLVTSTKPAELGLTSRGLPPDDSSTNFRLRRKGASKDAAESTDEQGTLS